MGKKIAWTDPAKADLRAIDQPTALRILHIRGSLSRHRRRHAHVNDFRSVLDSLKNARQADPISAGSTHLDREIQNVEEFLAKEEKNP